MIAESQENYPGMSIIFPAVKVSSHLKNDLPSLSIVIPEYDVNISFC